MRNIPVVNDEKKTLSHSSFDCIALGCKPCEDHHKKMDTIIQKLTEVDEIVKNYDRIKNLESSKISKDTQNTYNKSPDFSIDNSQISKIFKASDAISQGTSSNFILSQINDVTSNTTKQSNAPQKNSPPK